MSASRRFYTGVPVTTHLLCAMCFLRMSIEIGTLSFRMITWLIGRRSSPPKLAGRDAHSHKVWRPLYYMEANCQQDYIRAECELPNPPHRHRVPTAGVVVEFFPLDIGRKGNFFRTVLVPEVNKRSTNFISP